MKEIKKEKKLVLRLEADLLEAVDKHARNNRLSRSHVVRALLQEVFLRIEHAPLVLNGGAR